MNEIEKARKLLKDDGWVFIKKIGSLEVWKKFNFKVYFDPGLSYEPVCTEVGHADKNEKPPV